MTLQVRGSDKDRDGDIIGLCGVGWRHTKAQAVSNIKLNPAAYLVSVGGRSVYVKVGRRNGGDYLTTAADSYSPNNLDNMPDC
ncbi:DUF3892 domain-containing protein [Leucobacter iarius]|uniref:DUF3892 domain-containing protein n=1 Tax=Leucobacter iarius TaxID=333963 RepID=A0ABN2LF57_9MICO